MMESVCRLAKRALGGGRVVVGRGACGGPGIFPFSARTGWTALWYTVGVVGVASIFAAARAQTPVSELEDLRDVLREWQTARLPLDGTNWFPAGDFVLSSADGGLGAVAEGAVPSPEGCWRLYVTEDSRTGETLFSDALGLPLATLPGAGPSADQGGPWDPSRVGISLDLISTGHPVPSSQTAESVVAAIPNGLAEDTETGLPAATDLAAEGSSAAAVSSADVRGTSRIVRPAADFIAETGATPTNVSTVVRVPARTVRTQSVGRMTAMSSTGETPGAGMAAGDNISVTRIRTREIAALDRDGVLFYDFSSSPTDGVVDDLTGNGYDGAVSGCEWTAGGRFNGGAMLFDDNGDSINVGTGLDFPTWSRYSVSIWFRHDGGGDMGPQYGHKMLDKTTWYHDWHLHLSPPNQEGGASTGGIGLTIYEGGVGGGLGDNSANYADDEWHHVVVVRDGGHGEFWVDGVLRDQTEGMFSVYSSSALCVGNSYSGDYYQRKAWHGSLDEVRVFDRAISADEIRSLHAHGSPSTLVVHFESGAEVRGDLVVMGQASVGGVMYALPLGDLSCGDYTNGVPPCVVGR